MREIEGTVWPPPHIYANITDGVDSAAARVVWILSVDCVGPDYGLELEGEGREEVEALCCPVGEGGEDSGFTG